MLVPRRRASQARTPRVLPPLNRQDPAQAQAQTQIPALDLGQHPQRLVEHRPRAGSIPLHQCQRPQVEERPADERVVLECAEERQRLLEDCPRGCTHGTDEPECGLDVAVAAGEADVDRVQSFRRLLTARSNDDY